MWSSFFLSALLFFGQQPAASKPQQTGILTGTVVSGPNPISHPVTVILLPPAYEKIWDADVQIRLDNYWERYKPVFARNKESFSDISRRAYAESLEYIVEKIQHNSNSDAATALIRKTSADGRFEFKNLSLGYYKILATDDVDGRNRVWQEMVNVDSAVPVFLQVKTQLQ